METIGLGWMSGWTKTMALGRTNAKSGVGGMPTAGAARRRRFVSANEGGSLSARLLLGEDAQHEVSLAVGLEGGRHHDVLAGRQAQARADLTQVDELLGASAGRVGQEEIARQVEPGATQVLLGWERKGGAEEGRPDAVSDA